MQEIFQLLRIAAVLFVCYTIYAIIMAYYATYIAKTRPIYHGRFLNGKEFLDAKTLKNAIGCSFKENFKEFYLPQKWQH